MDIAIKRAVCYEDLRSFRHICTGEAQFLLQFYGRFCMAVASLRLLVWGTGGGFLRLLEVK